jgi:Transposase IS116/IS110/IS902 family
MIAAVGNGAHFRRARDMAAWIGLVPRQYSTGGHSRLLGISKRGNGYLRRLLVQGARAVINKVDRNQHRFGSWLTQLEKRAHRNIVAVSMANKLARIAWAVLRQDVFRANTGRCIQRAGRCWLHNLDDIGDLRWAPSAARRLPRSARAHGLPTPPRFSSHSARVCPTLMSAQNSFEYFRPSLNPGNERLSVRRPA